MKRKFIFSSTLAVLLASTVVAQTPGGVSSGLTAWYHAEAGTTPATGALTSWANQVTNTSLNLLSVATVSGGTAPAVVNNTPGPFNFHSYLQHNNSAMIYVTPSTATVNTTAVLGTTEGTMIGVGTKSDQLVVVNSTSTSSPFDASRRRSGTVNTGTQFSSTTSVQNLLVYATGAVVNTNNANIFGSRVKVAGTPVQENTFNGSINAGNSAVARPAGNYRFGIGSFPGYAYATGRSAEVVCYNRQLTSNEFSRVQGYLAVKYGVTLGTSTTPADYLSSNSTVIWPAIAAYQNNVTGIGRDDSSGLVQKESKAVTARSRIAIYNDNTGGIFPAMNVDNATTFAADQSFAMFGDDNGDTLLSKCAIAGKVVRIGRVWKMLKTGAVGNVTLAFTSTDFPSGVTNLLVSTDNTFPEASTTIIPLTTSGTLKYAVMPADNTYFSFSADPLNITFTVVDITCAATIGGSVNATVTGGIAPISYSWNTTPAQTTTSISDIAAGDYTLTVTQAAGCNTSQQATVANHYIDLTANLTPKDVKCNGDDNGSIAVTNTNGTAPYSYALNSQNNWGSNNHFPNLSEGFYTVYLKDTNGCTGKDTVSIHQPDALSLSIKPTDDYCEVSRDNANGNAAITLAGGTAPYSVWLNGTSIAPSLEVANLSKGHYTYAVSDANGCDVEDTFSVKHISCCYVFVPNAFTPNGDGSNDIFKVESKGNITLNKLTIYNRYGQEIYNNYDLNKGWDGTMKGAPVDVGTYFYNIKYTCQSLTGPKVTEVNGDVTVIK
jgi:gliding motility-associated-like protein